MFWTKTNVSTRKVILSVAVLCLAAAGLIAGSQFNSTDASTAVSANSSAASPSAVFPGTNTGAIPDGLTGTPPQFGAPRDISFVVSGVSGPVTNVALDFTLTHTWVGDAEMVLMAPGGTPSLHIASRIGVTTAGSFGDSSNFGGTYIFNDTAAGSNIWTVATAGTCGDACIVTAGSYRTVGPGQTGQTNPAPVTSLNTTFAISSAAANGTWILRFRDAAAADLGSVTAANLTVEPTGPVVTPIDVPVDFNGDGRSDYVVVRNVGGGASGQVRWFYNLSSGGATIAKDWGLATDFFINGNWDTDGLDDIAVWRPGSAGVAAFYVLRSTDNSAIVEPFGQTGDDPTVVEDYNNDGRTDFAVYRSGASAGLGSTWFWRSASTLGGAVNYVLWGQNGDFPAPGDYDGDGSADYVIQRNDGGGQARFWQRFATGTQTSVVFGTPTDVIVPGDYDDDGKTDIATVRGSGGNILWFYDPSSTAPVDPIQNTWGLSATDFPTQGDYDGDGRTDLAIWRNGVFWVYNLQSAAVNNLALGSAGDYPVANFNSH
jgi:hypothetical protein